MKMLSLVLVSIVSFHLHAQSINELLGYSKEDKLLILHADDIGVSHSENAATIATYENGLVISGSAMVPCPWFLEIVDWTKQHPDYDMGLHLTLTSEWDEYKWGPVAPANEVPSLIATDGYMHSGRTDAILEANIMEVETELRAQIERSIAMGLDPTHLDPHMFVLFNRVDFIELLVKLGKEYKIPVLLDQERLQANYEEDLSPIFGGYSVSVDSIYGAEAPHFESGMSDYYRNALNLIQPGLNYMFIHPAYDDAEMQAVTKNYEPWGSKWRQEDYNFFMSKECEELISKNDIKLITWREIRDKVIRAHE